MVLFDNSDGETVFKMKLTESQSCEIVKIVKSFESGKIAGASTSGDFKPSDIIISDIIFYKNVGKVIINYYFKKDVIIDEFYPHLYKHLYKHSYTLLKNSIFKSQIIEYQNVSNWYKSYIRDYLIDEIIESNS